MDIFNVRDLRERPGALIRDAEQGHLAMVTKRGHPVFIAVPFTEELVKLGLSKALALRMLEEKHITLRQAAKIAGVSLEEMIDLISYTDMSVVDYEPSELDQEIDID
jgi:antitoxin (DNA-binding transcriptional repressor) of toxin-antitoxin stability system